MRRPKSAAKRQRNAAATRAAILQSARQAFARAGYAGAGVREIARGAGVTAMLVNRYFGSKERLFAEAVAESMATTSVLAPQIASASISGKALAAALVGITKADAAPTEGFQIMLRSAASESAARIGRQLIERHHHKRIVSTLPGWPDVSVLRSAARAGATAVLNLEAASPGDIRVRMDNIRKRCK